MPEGHTLHRLALDLTGTFGGKSVRSTSPQGRFEAAAGLDGRELVEATAHGKHLFVAFSGTEQQAHVHLGLYGSFAFVEDPEPPVVGQVRWRLASDRVTADLRGPTACELLTPGEVEAVLARLGEDPLDPDADVERAAALVARSRAPIATLLMDQRVIAGVGNVYRAEVLFRHRLDPKTPGRDLRPSTFLAIWSDLVDLMGEGVRTGRIDTVRPEHEPEAMGRPPREDDHGGEVYVYRRDGRPCHVCGTKVRTEVLAARNLFWCPRCQRRR
ncbi:Fpg/Nei family DNA glycosylase [Aeromicrobium tamlense]|uniref:DNA-(apurinic or apyrimidinic site) lyase n=1 Tax=Aeromicrobium tamlense TaxID=375541 RepID=A0A8I0KLV4_9ACTN|nr:MULTISPECIES: Fpg/Nei family DNA glycosylase [Aeromicrobium]MBD1269034.1 Fpg/Nei family DNA glycosylase [Aeromicrobium tamlense]NYI37058.1 DNA-formamidopyrimidine glycosylase [Aeromicrobium tamlense]